jgi:hypothetical protein
MKRTEGNIGESDKTSVKVHHAPGGQSNFSLGWGNDAPAQQPKGTCYCELGNKYHNQSSIVFGDEPQKPVQQKPAQQAPQPVEQPKPTQPVKAPTEPQQPQQQPQNQQKTSVKVHNPPGGKSSITFG